MSPSPASPHCGLRSEGKHRGRPTTPEWNRCLPALPTTTPSPQPPFIPSTNLYKGFIPFIYHRAHARTSARYRTNIRIRFRALEKQRPRLSNVPRQRVSPGAGKHEIGVLYQNTRSFPEMTRQSRPRTRHGICRAPSARASAESSTCMRFVFKDNCTSYTGTRDIPTPRSLTQTRHDPSCR